MRRWVTHILFTAALVSLSGAVAANYPTKPIRLIVPYSAGGGNDLLARELAQALTTRLGQAVVVENKPGAGGNIGASFVARSEADGYTILLAAITFAINPALFDEMPFDVRKDFSPISLVAKNDMILAVHPSVPASNVQELIAHSKSNRNSLNYATPGIGTPHHLAGALFNSVAGTEMVHVPFKGGAQVIQELVSGRVHVTFSVSTTLIPQINAGKVRALAIAGNERSEVVPNLPTVSQSGLPGFSIDNWYGILAPAGTPAAIIEKLSSEIAAVTKEPEFRTRLLASGFEMVGSDSARFSTFLNNELTRWAKVVKDVNIKTE